MTVLSKEAPPGVGVDSRGDVAFDPSENVKALSEAAQKRQDDLRASWGELTEAKLDSLKELIKLRADYSDALRDAESRRVNEVLTLRADYDKRLGEAEAKRIDAIRAVDVNAVSVASQRASDQATVLANQVAQSAEALRSLVATTANTVAQSQQQLATTLSARLTTLEQGSYQALGKQSFSDPAFAELLGQVKILRESSERSTGVGAGSATSWGIIASIAALLIALSGTLYAVTRSSAPVPQFYTPAPPGAK